MPKAKRLVNCVVLSCLHKPGVIWRFFRKYYFYRLDKRIESLPGLARKQGRSYSGAEGSFYVL